MYLWLFCLFFECFSCVFELHLFNSSPIQDLRHPIRHFALISTDCEPLLPIPARCFRDDA